MRNLIEAFKDMRYGTTREKVTYWVAKVVIPILVVASIALYVVRTFVLN